ncbi:hypothetical protein BSG1_19884 [Bacillus sp. SG-1]|nr:hypothetical protein BSG1_19884 [Bacillus sp. SG-1]
MLSFAADGGSCGVDAGFVWLNAYEYLPDISIKIVSTKKRKFLPVNEKMTNNFSVSRH